MKKVLLLGVTWLLLAGSAQGATVISPESGTSHPYQRWVDQAKVPTPDVTLTVIEEDCADTPACTWQGGYTILFAPPSAARQIFLHELGHNFDYYSLTDADRTAFTGLTGEQEWDREVFANVYRFCAMGLRRSKGHEVPPIARAKMPAACYLIRH